MGFFGFVFWMVVLWLGYRTWRRWERRRWVAAGPNGYGPYNGWYDSREFYTPRHRELDAKRQGTREEQQAYIDSLETRVTELEERLDFTERLLAERRESASQT
ncbi:MAG TPA: hypothetical protein VFS51_12025 [Gemmatimonadales bacterium]|nr:hypothetical protein [Gemmatimonadales bacterium]